jgi:predicted nucleic acid-binding protein
MPILLDTGILGRLANRADALHGLAKAAVAELHRRGEVLHVAPQNLVEFRNFATRPASANGLGLTSAAAEGLATAFESAFPLLDETPDIFPAWKDPVAALAVTGKQVHDARLVAICHVRAVTHVLTFNIGHFHRLAGYGLGITVLDPASV